MDDQDPTPNVVELDFTKNQPADGQLLFVGPEGVEYLRFFPDGRVTIRGQQVDDNHLVYQAFRGWMESMGMLPATARPSPEPSGYFIDAEVE